MQVALNGSIVAGPTGAGDNAFPGAVYTASLATTPSPKQSQVQDSSTRNLQSANAYVGLSGVGVTDTVTRGNFLYIRTQSLIWVRLTMVNTPADTVSEIPVQGVFIAEFPDTNALKLLEAKGTGFIEYFVSGNQ